MFNFILKSNFSFFKNWAPKNLVFIFFGIFLFEINANGYCTISGENLNKLPGINCDELIECGSTGDTIQAGFIGKFGNSEENTKNLNATVTNVCGEAPKGYVKKLLSKKIVTNICNASTSLSNSRYENRDQEFENQIADDVVVFYCLEKKGGDPTIARAAESKDFCLTAYTNAMSACDANSVQEKRDIRDGASITRMALGSTLGAGAASACSAAYKAGGGLLMDMTKDKAECTEKINACKTTCGNDSTLAKHPIGNEQKTGAQVSALCNEKDPDGPNSSWAKPIQETITSLTAGASCLTQLGAFGNDDFDISSQLAALGLCNQNPQICASPDYSGFAVGNTYGGGGDLSASGTRSGVTDGGGGLDPSAFNNFGSTDEIPDPFAGTDPVKNQDQAASGGGAPGRGGAGAASGSGLNPSGKSGAGGAAPAEKRSLVNGFMSAANSFMNSLLGGNKNENPGASKANEKNKNTLSIIKPNLPQRDLASANIVGPDGMSARLGLTNFQKVNNGAYRYSKK